MEQGAAGGTWLIEVTVNLGHVRQTVAAVSRLRTICSTRLKNILVSALLVPLWQLYDPLPLSFQAPLFSPYLRPLSSSASCQPPLHQRVKKSTTFKLSLTLSLSLSEVYLSQFGQKLQLHLGRWILAVPTADYVDRHASLKLETQVRMLGED